MANEITKKVPVVTLCGSTRFKSTFSYVQRILALRGIAIMGLELTEYDKHVLDKKRQELLDYAHLRKIEISDAIVVIDCKLTDESEQSLTAIKYVGETTAEEIQFAKSNHKLVYNLSEYDYNNGLDGLAETIKRNSVVGERVYISGPISGIDIDVVKENFERAEKKLLDDYKIPVNPMGVNLGRGAKWQEYMQIDLQLLFTCDAIYMLKGYENSKGAMIELEIAKNSNMPIYYEQ